MTSIVDAESVLALDVGSVHTRALLFDVVDGQYHFLAAGVAPSTAGAPFFDIGEGVHIAISRLQEITGRPLLGSEDRLKIPTQADGSGVDRLALTMSAGRELTVIAAGLLGDVSLESAQRLAATTYARVVEKIGLNDQRRNDVLLDSIVQARADLVLMSGGTERGATRSVGKQVELLLLACKILPEGLRPRVIYCGNSVLGKRIQEVVGRYTEVHLTPNIRPGIDSEDLGPAAEALSRMTASLRAQQISGVSALAQMCAAPPVPTAWATGRLMRFISQVVDRTRGVLAVDLGASATTLAAAINGRLTLNVSVPLGVGSGLGELLRVSSPGEVSRWLAQDITEAEIRDYLMEKSARPATLPATLSALAIEQAAARQALRIASAQLAERYPSLGMSFEPIFAGGAILGQAPSPAQSLLMVLDGLQPEGVTTVFLDPYGLMPALGAVAPFNTVLPVQILESGTFVNLAAVISPISQARPGTPVLRVRVAYDDKDETSLEIRQGALTPLPIRHGQTVQIRLEALHGAALDRQGRTTGRFKITGGVLGAVIDARGRPFGLPADAGKRRELLLRWAGALESRRPA